jgi:hypothetical protein
LGEKDHVVAEYGDHTITTTESHDAYRLTCEIVYESAIDVTLTITLSIEYDTDGNGTLREQSRTKG